MKKSSPSRLNKMVRNQLAAKAVRVINMEQGGVTGVLLCDTPAQYVVRLPNGKTVSWYKGECELAPSDQS